MDLWANYVVTRAELSNYQGLALVSPGVATPLVHIALTNLNELIVQKSMNFSMICMAALNQ